MHRRGWRCQLRRKRWCGWLWDGSGALGEDDDDLFLRAGRGVEAATLENMLPPEEKEELDAGGVDILGEAGWMKFG